MSNTDYTPQMNTPPPGPPYQAAPAKGTNGLAVAGFVVALLGLLMFWIPLLNILGMILGVIGAILAGIGLAKSKTVGAGKGLAITGLVMGALAVILAIVVNVAFVDAVDDVIKDTTGTSVDSSAGSSDDSLGETRDNPAPLGSAVTGGDWTVTINSVDTVNEDSWGDKAAAGSTLLQINMTATYNGDDPQGASAWASVMFVGADGTTFDTTGGSTYFSAEDAFDSSKTVYEGGSVSGNQLLEIPADGWEDGVLAVTPDLMVDDTFVAVK